MKKICILFMLALFMSSAVAAPAAVNLYRIEKRPTAPELNPDQYTVSENDRATVTKPPFSFYTQLNTEKPDVLYLIPPYEFANQLPQIGKWMIAVETGQKTVNYVPSHWLDDLSASGQYIIEPINYIFVVHKDNEKDAIKTIEDSLSAAGFTSKWSGPEYHSDNYHAYLGDQRVSQLKRKDGVFLTYSNFNWLHQNDHLRVMGPYKTTINNQTVYLFVSSVSEETAWDQKLYAGHHFVSFSHARNNVADALIAKGHPTYYVLSDNILNVAKETTADHDGKIFVTVFK